jgi:hypothetical protein
MMRLLIAAIALLGLLAACSGSKPAAATRTTTTVRHAARAPTTTTTISHAQAVAERENPTHDPGKCVRQLPNGNIQVTIKDFVAKNAPKPTGPSPFGWCG